MWRRCRAIRKILIKFFVAAGLYTAFAVYLYQPYFKNSKMLVYFLPLSSIAGAVGTFLLSRRWIAGFAGSFFAGALYGFGPFVLGLSSFHPAASVLAATVPFCFLPAAYGPKGRLRYLSYALVILPFLAVIVFFQMCVHIHLFPISAHLALRFTDVAGSLFPLAAAEGGFRPVGLYHIPLAAFLIGFVMMIKSQRVGILLIIIASTVLAFSRSVGQESPLMWFSIPSVCCAIIAGSGIEALIIASRPDKNWILAAAIFLGVLVLVTLLQAAKYLPVFIGLANAGSEPFSVSARIYLLGVITLLVVFFLTRANIRLTAVRRLTLACAIGVDIFLSSQYILDSILRH